MAFPPTGTRQPPNASLRRRRIRVIFLPCPQTKKKESASSSYVDSVGLCFFSFFAPSSPYRLCSVVFLVACLLASVLPRLSKLLPLSLSPSSGLIACYFRRISRASVDGSSLCLSVLLSFPSHFAASRLTFPPVDIREVQQWILPTTFGLDAVRKGPRGTKDREASKKKKKPPSAFPFSPQPPSPPKLTDG